MNKATPVIDLFGGPGVSPEAVIATHRPIAEAQFFSSTGSPISPR